VSAQSAVPGVFDLAVVGAGIIGLSCARAAALKGLRVVVIDRDAQANGASVRNFGLVVVAGQERGAAWNRAHRSCAIWQQVAQEAGIRILQRGLWITARRPEALPIFEAFLKTEMGEGCEILSREAAQARCPELAGKELHAVLVSLNSIRVESRQAIPKIADWLHARCGVQFLRNTAVLAVEPPRLETSRGIVQAGAVAVCPGDDLSGLYAPRIAAYHVTMWWHTLIELWAWHQPQKQLSDRSASPWDDATRRPSHSDRRNAMRRHCLEHDYRHEGVVRSIPRKIRCLWKRLMKLVA